ncbi:hypothetical protein M885DRAFT_517022 [Pelagophyceae sp. CCMP2097]|nr:hypothetical protein M885DRAFT_517022 [Pelagophyceae sp. CCMP2097]
MAEPAPAAAPALPPAYAAEAPAPAAAAPAAAAPAAPAAATLDGDLAARDGDLAGLDDLALLSLLPDRAALVGLLRKLDAADSAVVLGLVAALRGQAAEQQRRDAPGPRQQRDASPRRRRRQPRPLTAAEARHARASYGAPLELVPLPGRGRRAPPGLETADGEPADVGSAAAPPADGEAPTRPDGTKDQASSKPPATCFGRAALPFDRRAAKRVPCKAIPVPSPPLPARLKVEQLLRLDPPPPPVLLDARATSVQSADRPEAHHSAAWGGHRCGPRSVSPAPATPKSNAADAFGLWPLAPEGPAPAARLASPLKQSVPEGFPDRVAVLTVLAAPEPELEAPAPVPAGRGASHAVGACPPAAVLRPEDASPYDSSQPAVLRWGDDARRRAAHDECVAWHAAKLHRSRERGAAKAAVHAALRSSWAPTGGAVSLDVAAAELAQKRIGRGARRRLSKSASATGPPSAATAPRGVYRQPKDWERPPDAASFDCSVGFEAMRRRGLAQEKRPPSNKDHRARVALSPLLLPAAPTAKQQPTRRVHVNERTGSLTLY